LGNIGSQGRDLIGKGFSNGFQIAGNVSKDAFDIQRNVATGIAGLGGTAVDGVITVRSTSILSFQYLAYRWTFRQ